MPEQPVAGNGRLAVVSDKALKVETGTCVLQVGKRKFAKVTLN